jgi:hypothetical protein
MFRLILICALFAASNVAHAEMYKIINEYGEIIFTDTKPSIDAKEHHPGHISSVKNESFNKKRIKADKKAREKAEQETSDNK